MHRESIIQFYHNIISVNIEASNLNQNRHGLFPHVKSYVTSKIRNTL